MKLAFVRLSVWGRRETGALTHFDNGEVVPGHCVVLFQVVVLFHVALAGCLVPPAELQSGHVEIVGHMSRDVESPGMCKI
mgnify:CR=1